MAFDGTGNYNLPEPEYPAVAGEVILSASFNTIVEDIAAALSNVLVRDGQAAMLADLPMGGKEIKALGRGLVSAPGLRFQSDTDTGLFSSGPDVVGLVAGGTEVLSAKADGVRYTVSEQVTTPADFEMDSTTPNGRVEFTTINAGGWNLTSGTMMVEFDFLSTDFFAENPDAHLAVVLRCDTSVIATYVRGNGLLIGNATGAQEFTDHFPTTMIETWHNGLSPPANQRYLIPGSEGYADKLLEDGVQYKMVVYSTVRPSGAKYVRYQVYRYNTPYSAWDLERDTGDVLDQNPFIDATKANLVFGYVFTNPGAGPWTIDITNLKVRWGAAHQYAAHVPTWAKFQIADLTGPNNIGGTAALAFADDAFDYDEVCTVGGIEAYLSNFTAGQKSQIETVLRPVYCHLDRLIAAGRRG